MDEEVLQYIDTVDSDSSCGTIVVSTSGRQARCHGYGKIESIIVRRNDHRRTFRRLFPGPLEDQRMCRSVSPTNLLSSSGPLMLRSTTAGSR